jgi:FkbM family methyltransferase
MFKSINDLVVDLSKDPFNPILSFKIAMEYEKAGQTASAVSFYLRAAEYGYNSHPEYVYTSLLKSAQCFENQKNRESTVHNLFLKAVAYIPTRPEAWFLLARYCERAKRWQEAYTFSETGLMYTKNKVNALPTWVDYPGEYCLIFEKAVAGWWVGRKDESYDLFQEILKKDITHGYRTAILGNLKLFETREYIDPLEPVVTNFRKHFDSDAPIIIDIGTRDGDDAYYLYKKLNSTRVIAVDANVNAISQTKSNYPWMDIIYTAITEKDGQTDFHIVNGEDKESSGTSSVFNKDRSISPSPEYYADKIQKITVPSTRMDTLLSNLGVNDKIDVVKVDTEGYSWQVLQGFGDRLKDVRLFHLETEKTSVHDHHVTTDKITEFMNNNGFALIDVSYEWGWNIEDQVWVNKALVIRHPECFSSK